MRTKTEIVNPQHLRAPGQQGGAHKCRTERIEVQVHDGEHVVVHYLRAARFYGMADIKYVRDRTGCSLGVAIKALRWTDNNTYAIDLIRMEGR